MKNRITNMTTEAIDADDGPKHCIFISIDVEDLHDITDFILAVGDGFLKLRMMSPPDTHLMLVSIIGALDANSFRTHWLKMCALRPEIGAFMSMMARADAIQGNRQGDILSSCSLATVPH